MQRTLNFVLKCDGIRVGSSRDLLRFEMMSLASSRRIYCRGKSGNRETSKNKELTLIVQDRDSYGLTKMRVVRFVTQFTGKFEV